MCDYVYLDGSSATIDSDFMLNWYIDNRYLRHYKGNQKVFVSLQQISFQFEEITTQDVVDIQIQSELITNINLKNSYNTKGSYKVLSLCDSSFIILVDGADKIKTIRTSTCNNNYYMVYETDTPLLIQLGIIVLNTKIQFTDLHKVNFKCLLKFEYEDI